MRRATIRHGAEPWGAGWAPVVELEGRRVGAPPPGALDRDYAEELARARAIALAESLAPKVVVVEPLNLDDGLRVSGQLMEPIRQEAARIARVLHTARGCPHVCLARGYARELATRLGTPVAEIEAAIPPRG